VFQNGSLRRLIRCQGFQDTGTAYITGVMACQRRRLRRSDSAPYACPFPRWSPIQWQDGELVSVRIRWILPHPPTCGSDRPGLAYKGHWL